MSVIYIYLYAYNMYIVWKLSIMHQYENFKLDILGKTFRRQGAFSSEFGENAQS